MKAEASDSDLAHQHDPEIFHTDEVPNNTKLKYPRSVFFIVSNEFCERFSFYGMRTILALYFKNKLDYSSDTSTVIYHVFVMFVYFFPLIGALIADSLLGKFRTILYLSIVYAVGQLLLSASAAPTLGLPIREFSLFGLFLIALGTGGIKPCVAAFGGDQFILPQQEKYLAMFFSVFYFAINSGSLVSTFLTPELRNGVQCFGDQTCYSLAFFVPAILMILSIVLFVIGKPMYRMKKPEGNVVFTVTKCISHAIYNKVTSKKVTRDHWLDHADDKYDSKLIADIKSTLQVLKLFIPLPFFWALFDQQGSRWTFQATRMDGEIGSFLIKADQMQVLNPLFIVIMIPIFETCIYPVMNKLNFINTPLKKLTTGGLLAAVAFIVSALVELQLEKTYPILPSSGNGQLRLFNTRNCSLPIQINNQSFEMAAFDMWEEKNIDVMGSRSIEYSVDYSKCGEGSLETGFIDVIEEKAMSYVLFPGSKFGFKDQVNKTESGNPAIRVLSYNKLKNDLNVELIEKSKTIFTFTMDKTSNSPVKNSVFGDFNPGTYDVSVNGTIVNTIVMKLGGVYTIQIYTTEEFIKTDFTTVIPPNSMNILWLIPQYIIITVAEVLFSVTGLEFAFTQAPISMKSLLQAGWLLTVAFGNLIVVIIAEAKFFNSQTYEFFLFAGLMIIDMIIFAIMAKLYKYVQFVDDESNSNDDDDDNTIDDLAMKETNSHDNPSFFMKNET